MQEQDAKDCSPSYKKVDGSPVAARVDADFYCNFPSREKTRQAFKQLTSSRCQLWLLLGEKGVGKRTFIQQFVCQCVPSDAIFIQGRQGVNCDNLLKAIATQLSLSQLEITEALQEKCQNLIRQLAQLHCEKIVIIQNANDLPKETLRTLWELLLALATHKTNRLRFILIGNTNLARSIEAMQQKFSTKVSVHQETLLPLERQDIQLFLKYYTEHVLTSEPSIITPIVVARIHRLTGGSLTRIMRVTEQVLQQQQNMPNQSSVLVAHNPTTGTMAYLVRAVTLIRKNKRYIFGLLCLMLVFLYAAYHLLLVERRTVKPRFIQKTTIPSLQQKTALPLPLTLKQAPSFGPSGYTIQIIGTHHFERLVQFVEDHQLNHLAHQAFYYRMIHQAKPWYVLIYGKVHSYRQAQNLMHEIPEDVRNAMHPWVRSLSSLYQQVVSPV